MTARNSLGSVTVISTESAVVTEPLPAGAIRLPSGEYSIPAASVPSNHRLVVSQVLFSPNPVTGRNQVLTVRVRAKDTRGFVIRDALVFVRSTPRVTTGGDRQVTTTDGWVTYQLAPNGNFPKPRRGYNVQFFVKVYRSGDPGLGGIAGYRLVQVRLARLTDRKGRLCTGPYTRLRSSLERGPARDPGRARGARGAPRSGPSRRPGRGPAQSSRQRICSGSSRATASRAHALNCRWSSTT